MAADAQDSDHENGPKADMEGGKATAEDVFVTTINCLKGSSGGAFHLNSSPDGTTMIVPAINVQGSTSDLDLVGTDIMGMKWQHGSTYMAQDLILMLDPSCSLKKEGLKFCTPSL